MARFVSLGILTLLIIILGITFYHVVAPFLLPLFLAGVVSLLFRPFYRACLEKVGNRPAWAAGITTAITLAVILIPAIAGTFFATSELLALGKTIRTSPEVKKTIQELQSAEWMESLARGIQPLLGPQANEEQIVKEIETGLQQAIAEVAKKTLGIAGAALGLLGNLFTGIISLGMFTIALYYFLSDGPRLLDATQNLIPVKIDYQKQLFAQFEKSVRAVVASTFLAALAQGFFTTIILYFLGFQKFFLLFFLTTFVSMIPLAGAWFVWFPCACWLAYTGHWGQATFLFIYGAGFIGMLDNLIRTYILHTDVKLHPLLAFVSVLGGVQAMGLWGVFIAPIVASCLYALILIFNTELKELSKEQLKILKQRLRGNDKQPTESSGEEAAIETTTADKNVVDADQPAEKTPEKPATNKPSRKSRRKRKR